MQIAKGFYLIQEIQEKKEDSLGGFILPNEVNSDIINGVVKKASTDGFAIEEQKVIFNKSGAPTVSINEEKLLLVEEKNIYIILD